MVGQTVSIGTMVVSAEEKSMVGEEQLANNTQKAADETWSKSILTDDNKIKNDPSQK